uniref:Uncharacterized protein n=1 Tax=Kwoniella bestiolae CBS 10118 TaxID=1296100 RepID=A0A1B9GFF6_9TREE|nr:hypothetical protein I302_01297 [Kwoniella bestiolae CBS 10118]OCF29784.1 hypothetical protein I302_01297 [Kwoniella bestiolae CBS 10118]
MGNKKNQGFTLVPCPCPYGYGSITDDKTSEKAQINEDDTEVSGHTMKWSDGEDVPANLSRMRRSITIQLAKRTTNVIRHGVEDHDSYKRRCLLEGLHPKAWQHLKFDLVSGRKPEGVQLLGKRKGSHRQLHDEDRSKRWSGMSRIRNSGRNTIQRQNPSQEDDDAPSWTEYVAAVSIEEETDGTTARSKIKNIITRTARCEGRRVLNPRTALNQSQETTSHKKYGRGVDEEGRCQSEYPAMSLWEVLSQLPCEQVEDVLEIMLGFANEDGIIPTRLDADVDTPNRSDIFKDEELDSAMPPSSLMSWSSSSCDAHAADTNPNTDIDSDIEGSENGGGYATKL